MLKPQKFMKMPYSDISHLVKQINNGVSAPLGTRQLYKQLTFIYIANSRMCLCSKIFPICCGIDVNKKFVVATIGSKSGVTDYRTRKFQPLPRVYFNFWIG